MMQLSNIEVTLMKKIFVLVLAMLITALVFTQAMAANYPQIELDVHDSAVTIPEGEQGRINFTITAAYANERVQVRLYTETGKLIGIGSNSFYNAPVVQYTLTIDTGLMALKPGVYKVVYWMEYYAQNRWKQVPEQHTYVIRVIENTCMGDHDFKKKEVYTESTCISQGFARYVCRDCGHSEDRAMPLGDHVYGETVIVQMPTPDAAGKCEKTCTECGEKTIEEIAVGAVVKITAQPKNAVVSLNETAKFTVKATGDGLSYQWYYKNAGSSVWKAASGTKASYSIKNTVDRNGRSFYCVVTDQYGNSEKSDVVTMQFPVVSISKQPKDACAIEGEKAKLTIAATGDGLKYQWYYKSPEGTAWKKASGTTTSYSLEMTQARDGRLMKCVVTDQYGNTVESDIVTLTTRYPVKITAQPGNAKAYAGEKAKTTVEAKGDGLKYQWYYKDPGMISYKKSSIVKASASVTMSEARDGRKMYCVVTDAYGYSAKSVTVTLSMKHPVEIVTQPKSASKTEGATAKFTVKATGDGLSYQWYYKSPTGSTWKKCSGTEATYSLKATEARDGRLLYCQITDAYGNVVKTKTVTLTVK